MTISNIIDTVTNTLDTAKIPANILPPLLIRCIALSRPGMSAYRTAVEIIQNCGKLGIPTGDNPNGAQNLINAYTYAVVKSVFNAIKNDATVQMAMPANSLLIQATGANAGGPVTCVGTNLIDSLANGIIQ